MGDDDIYLHSNFVLSGDYEFGNWQLEPKFTLRLKSQDFNSKYYAFKQETGESMMEE